MDSNFAKGCVWGIMLSIPSWILVIWLIASLVK